MAVVMAAAGSAPVWQAGRTRCKGQVLAVGHALAHPGFRKSSSWCIFGFCLLMVVLYLMVCLRLTPCHLIRPIVTGRMACP